jgi:hypothetical protein
LNLYEPYAASLVGRAAEAGEDPGCVVRLAASWGLDRLGSRDLERVAVGVVVGLAPGDFSNLSASALTLLAAWGEGREVDVEVEVAGPETDLGVVFGGDLAPFVIAWRWRVVGGMSMPWEGGGEGRGPVAG